MSSFITSAVPLHLGSLGSAGCIGRPLRCDANSNACLHYRGPCPFPIPIPIGSLLPKQAACSWHDGLLWHPDKPESIWATGGLEDPSFTHSWRPWKAFRPFKPCTSSLPDQGLPNHQFASFMQAVPAPTPLERRRLFSIFPIPSCRYPRSKVLATGAPEGQAGFGHVHCWLVPCITLTLLRFCFMQDSAVAIHNLDQKIPPSPRGDSIV